MIRSFLFALLLGGILFSCREKQPVDYVNPFIGTGFHGHTYPGASLPFGAVQLSSDTRRGNWDACSGYHYSDSTIIGFSHTHLSGTGCIDLGDVLFHPSVNNHDVSLGDSLYLPASFSHQNEIAQPGYYSVLLDNGIRAELTATEHVGIHRYSFPQGMSNGLVIDLAHLLDNETIHEASMGFAENEVYGMRRTTGWATNQHVYFVAQFSRPFDIAFRVNGQFVPSVKTVDAQRIQAVLDFAENMSQPLVVKVGISSVSIENARANLQAEVSDFNFDEVKDAARGNWNKQLSAYMVSGPNADDLTNFYTAVYHCMLTPNLISDVNGQYRGADMQVRSEERKNKVYSTFSLWDTFRAWNPLMTLTDTSLLNNMIRSMLHFYDQTGELPVWPLASSETGTMIGYHSVSVIYDAFSKNIRGYDVEKAYEAMKISAAKNKKGTSSYLDLGYIPADSKRESVSCLLENAYDDWCIARMARELGKDDDYQEFTERSLLYRNVFDGQTGFFRARNRDGSWETPFNPAEVGRAYTEATAWQYRFFVPHDVQGMVNLLGGYQSFSDALDSLFLTTEKTQGHLSDITGLIGQYAHGNEPSHHMAYLYSYAGQPWKTQQMTRRLLKEMYQPTPEGISGNEDCGQMSAWYVLSSLGLYQVCPGSGEFILTTPLFDEAKIRLANGRDLMISANDPARNTYISEVYWNDEPVTANFIRYSQLMEGGLLRFVLDSNIPANSKSEEKALPYSYSEPGEVSIPWVSSNLSLFENEVWVQAGTATSGAQVRYTLDGSEPTDESLLYTVPFLLKESAIIKLKAFAPNKKASALATYRATKAVFRKPDLQTAGKNGLRFSYYEGTFQRTSDIRQNGKLVKTGICSAVDLSQAVIPDHFGLIFDGYLYAPTDGIYTFSTQSDDGSVLRIGGQTVVDNDGSHAAIKASGRIALKKGYHVMELLYFEDYEGEFLAVSWKKPGEEQMKHIGAENYFTGVN